MLCLGLRAIVVLIGAGAFLGRAPEAHAADETEAPNPARTDAVPRYAWGLRLNGSFGGATLAYADNGAVVGRAGLDAEYWLSRNFGIGAQFAFESAQTFNLGAAYNTGSTSRASLAPAIAIRGSNPTSFPILTLALGYALGSSTEYHSCDLNTCRASYWTVGGSGPYASLMAAWLFHSGHVRPEGIAFALGPLVRLDWFALGDRPGASLGGAGDAFSNREFGWCFTTGLAIGFDVARNGAR